VLLLLVLVLPVERQEGGGRGLGARRGRVKGGGKGAEGKEEEEEEEAGTCSGGRCHDYQPVGISACGKGKIRLSARVGAARFRRMMMVVSKIERASKPRQESKGRRYKRDCPPPPSSSSLLAA